MSGKITHHPKLPAPPSSREPWTTRFLNWVDPDGAWNRIDLDVVPEEFFLVLRRSDLDAAAPVVDSTIKAAYPKNVDFDVYPLGKRGAEEFVALKSSDPAFYIGKDEVRALAQVGIPSTYAGHDRLATQQGKANAMTVVSQAGERMAAEKRQSVGMPGAPATGNESKL